MDRVEKFLRKLPARLRKRVLAACYAIRDGRMGNLDIASLKGRADWYRCRIGDIRIVFLRTRGEKSVIYDVGFRGGIYK